MIEEKTKDTILNDIWDCPDEPIELQTCITLNPDKRLIEGAMDQYAAYISISFLEWVVKNKWQPTAENQINPITFEQIDADGDVCSEDHTIPELFSIYKQTLK